MVKLEGRQQINWLWWRIIMLATLAAIFYYSWPLGYWLNPAIGRHGLASDLEAKGQPYNWVFVSLDVTSGLLIFGITLWLARTWHSFSNPSIKFILCGYGLFGVLTAFDALLPLNCLVDQKQCGPLIHNPIVLLHGLASIGSIGGLTLSIVGIWQLLVLTLKVAIRIRWLLYVIMIGWFGFGIITLVLILTAHSSNTAQHVFITICSVWTILMPFILGHLHAQEHELARILSSEDQS
jgi:hypothetical protein